jgi:hypothetical protein
MAAASTGTSTVARLARWAREATPHALPADLVTRAALHHLSTAAGLGRDGRCPAALSTATDPAGVADAGACVAHGAWDDFGFMGRPVTAAVVAAWGGAHGHRIDEMLLATAVGCELAARVGTWMLLGPDPVHAHTFVASAAAATTAAWLEEFDADGIANAIGAALRRPMALGAAQARSTSERAIAEGAAIRTALLAVREAGRGDASDSIVLDYDEGLPGVACWHPLRAAFDDLGATWLSRALCYRLEPVDPALLTAVQGFHEILRRHSKAASKRLRTDQVDRIEVRVDHLAWARLHPLPPSDSLPPPDVRALAPAHLIALLVASHEHGPALADAETWSAHADAIRTLAQKVVVRPDPGLTVRRLRGVSRTLAPLLTDLPPRARLALLRDMVRDVARTAPPPQSGDVRSLLRADPVALVADALDDRDASVGIGAADRAGGLHVPSPVALRLYTTRGGWWPERRDVIEGGPEYSLPDLERDVVDKFARAAAWRAEDPASAAADARERARRFLHAANDPTGPAGLTAPEAIALLRPST